MASQQKPVCTNLKKRLVHHCPPKIHSTVVGDWMYLLFRGTNSETEKKEEKNTHKYIDTSSRILNLKNTPEVCPFLCIIIVGNLTAINLIVDN